MNNHEKEQAYKEQLQYIEKKYKENIESLSKHYGGMETFICVKVLCENARDYRDGRTSEIWQGGGKVNMTELIKDVEKLDSFITYPTASNR